MTHTQKANADLKNHIIDNINNYEGTELDDLHHHLFNEDYYIIGYYNAEQWIKKNDLNTFEIINYCQEQEKENFGEIQNTFDNAEKLVNHYAYWRGQELLWAMSNDPMFLDGGELTHKHIAYIEKNYH